MSIILKLDREISCEYICARIQEMVSSYTKNNSDNQEILLYIDIKQIIDAEQQNPKLEYKNSEVDN